MHPTLEKLSQDIAQSIDGASTREMLYTPAEGVWSCALILEHLYRSYTGTCKGLDRVLEANAPLATALPFKWRFAQFRVLTMGRFPEGRKSPKTVEPQGADAANIRALFFHQITEMDTKLNECARRFGADRKVLDHPVLKALTVSQWRKFHLVHGEHHAKQLRERRALAEKAFTAP